MLKLVEASRYLLKLDFYSAGSACASIKNSRNLNIKNFGWVSHDCLVEALYEANILVNIAEKEGKQISSKIFEYMCMGKPIVHIYYSDNDVNLQYLRRYHLALCLQASDWNIEEKRDMFDKWCSFNFVREISFDIVSSLFSEMTPSYIVELIKTEMAQAITVN